MNLLALPAFGDNYIWMLHDGLDALVVDPGDSAPVLAALDALHLNLAAILVTHHHGDHVGGIDALRHRLSGNVFGPATERIPEPFQPVRGGNEVCAMDWVFGVIDVPGHTAGHIAFFAAPQGQAPVLFCGDTLFSGGCGRLFEGTAAQMLDSLSRLSELPGSTRVCCAHEYTLSNLRFARAVEANNPQLLAYQAWCEAQRAEGKPTLPSSINIERNINPFLRTQVPEVIGSAIGQGATSVDAVDVFAALRQWKNHF